MTIPITRSTVNIQAQCGVSSGRELHGVVSWKQAKRKGLKTWLALGDSKIDGKEGRKWERRQRRKEGRGEKKPLAHKSTAVTPFQVNLFEKQGAASSFRQQRHKDGIKTTRRWNDAFVKSTWPWAGGEPVMTYDLILLLNVLRGGRGSGWRGTLWPPAAWWSLPGIPSSGCGPWTRGSEDGRTEVNRKRMRENKKKTTVTKGYEGNE